MKNNIEQANGFLTSWLICGPTYGNLDIDKNAIPTNGIDDRLRNLISDELCVLPDKVSLGESYAGAAWHYWHSGNNIFVDVSKFYFHLCKINYYAYTQVEAKEDADLILCLWCCPATDVWVNGEQLISHEAAIYKPMRRVETSVHLHKGINDIFVQCQNLGVRDTRNIFGIQLQGSLAGLSCTLPDPDGRIGGLAAAAAWLKELRWTGESLLAPSAPPAECSAELSYMTEEKTVSWESGDALPVDADCKEINLTLLLHGEKLTRSFDLIEHKKPSYCDAGISLTEHRKKVMEEHEKTWTVCTPKDDTGIYSYAVFARMAENGGKISDEDKRILLHSLDIVDSCSDCSDFAMTALLRIMLTFSIEDTDLRERMKQVVLNFRYWMDEPGSDAMCFTSENHSLLFHGCQMAAGRMFPNETFRRSGLTGAEMFRLGNERCKAWLERILERGYEEFNSAGYMSVTATALLTPVDFGSEEVRTLANEALLRLLEQLAHHAFHGDAIGPMGRTYRDVIIPHRQEMQSLLYYINPKTPKSQSEFLCAFAKTSFVIPEKLAEIMDAPASMVYRSGSAEIDLEKTADYLLSSVSCPRRKYAEAADMDTFVPGAYGYQQHMWYAALDVNCVAYINHPGDSKDKGMMRPGYWFGNALMPALKQEGRVLGGIYYLDPMRHPIFFTHLYWPAYSLEESVTEPHWYFGRKGGGYMAIWSNLEGVPFDEVLTGCEYRFYGEHSAFLCMMGNAREDGSFTEFMRKAKALNPVLSQDGFALRAENGYHLEYK